MRIKDGGKLVPPALPKKGGLKAPPLPKAKNPNDPNKPKAPPLPKPGEKKKVVIPKKIEVKEEDVKKVAPKSPRQSIFGNNTNNMLEEIKKAQSKINHNDN